jgi:nucleotide-binding universal stress UspA family protein
VEDSVYFGQQTIRYLPAARDPAELASQNERLREAYAPGRALDVSYRTREGTAADEILRFSDEIGCDLIVMGTHGRTGLRRLLAGSVAEAVLRGARCPVLALRSAGLPREGGRVPLILHPTDFSEGSEPALRTARVLARDRGARLILLHVSPPDVVVDGTMVVGVDPRAERDSLEVIRARTDGPDLKYPVDARLVWGRAAVEILRMAGEVGCGLIVMGTHGRTGLGRLLVGSVAEEVLRGARCPVLAIKVPFPAPATARAPEPTAT